MSSLSGNYLRCLSITFVVLCSVAQTSAEEVRFDLPPVAVAVPSETDSSVVSFTLNLSSMIASPAAPRVDQWLVTIKPRNREGTIVDYAPRTETGSDISTPVQHKQSSEKSKSMGASVDGAYSQLLRGTIGSDQGTKDIDSVQFDRHAPVQAVAASGTIDRGRGVYFKLRWTAQQVLEGEKQFQVSMRVPKHWRGSIVDVRAVAQRAKKMFGGFDSEVVTVGAADFVVATYRHGDESARAAAVELADLEHALRSISLTASANRKATDPIGGLLKVFAASFEFDRQKASDQWLKRLLIGRADPHLDKSIAKLPMDVRVAVLDYIDVRENFESLATDHPNLNRKTVDHSEQHASADGKRLANDQTPISQPVLLQSVATELRQ